MDNVTRKNVFNAAHANRLRKLQPYPVTISATLTICNQCRYINPDTHLFCTNCGHPMDEHMPQNTVYNMRIKKRKMLQQQGEASVASARLTLYILSAVSFTGVALLLSHREDRYVLALASLIASALYMILARWSLHKPFTALVIGFVIIATFFVITIFSELYTAFATVKGLYSLALLLLVMYFLLKGIQGAYKADLIKEESQIL